MSDLAQLTRHYPSHIDRLQDEVGAAIAAAGYDGLLISSGQPPGQRHNDDQYWPLKPTPMFSHWLPLREPGCLLVIRPGEPAGLLRTSRPDFWEGPAPVESEHFWACFEVREVDAGAIRTELPAGRYAWVGECIDVADAAQVADGDRNPPGLVAALEAIRALKSEYEIQCTAEASRRAIAGHRRVAELFAGGGRSELELHLAYLEATAQDDGETPYKNIVALDRHAAVLHHVHYGRSAPRGSDHSLLVDAGATCLGYAADITRTHCRGSSADALLFAALVAAIEKLQRALCDRVVPGVPFESLHDHCHELLADVLRDVEIASASRDELVETGVTRAFLPHGLGHSLGIQVHDVGCRVTPPAQRNPFLRNTATLTPGHLVTVEPGCYFITELLAPLREQGSKIPIHWGVVDRLAPFGGVRIEDNLAIRPDRSENLTRDNWPG